MTGYDRIFGSGPTGAIISLLLFYGAYALESSLNLPAITHSQIVSHTLFLLLTALGIAIIIWSLKSLPPDDRGRHLVTSGAFKFFRHPLYAGFLSFINFGLAFLMNNWIYVIWAILILPVWHIVIRREETLMEKEFGQAYLDYCQTTGRFFLKVHIRKPS